MKILRAYKTEMAPNNRQRTALLKHAGAARFAYNWGLRRKQDAYAAWVAGGKQGKCCVPSAIDLHRELNVLKKLSQEDGGVPWMYESSKCAPQEALRDLDKAYNNFFRRCKQGAARKGFPRFKSRKRGIGSFRVTGAKATETHVRLPRLGSVRLKEHGYLPVSDVKVLSATVSESAGRWFVSLQVEQEIPISEPKALRVVGVDVGIKHLAVTSEGEVFDNPKALITSQNTLRTRQKAVSRKQKGSNNRKKAIRRLAILHRRITNVRKDAINKMTTSITKSASMIVLESLNVAGMMKNHCLARSLADASLSEIHRQLVYKVKWYGAELYKADRFYPSSKTCSKCGNVKDALLLSERIYHCETCGAVIDRDINAALNLKMLAASSAVTACCPGSADGPRKRNVKLLVGQEPNTIESHAE